MSFKIAVTSLNQWALDFEGNTRRIIESIVKACRLGAIYRTGPELELCGYSLEDAFYAKDTVYHCWESLKIILDSTEDLPIIIDIGMPIRLDALYNCRVICHMGRVLCIRAKTSLAGEGNYREYRHFSPWNASKGLIPFMLPSLITGTLDFVYVPFGADFVLDLIERRSDSKLRIGWEICQELWDIKNVSSELYAKYGSHLVINSSSSYWELRKLNTVNDMIRGISLRAGACYVYCNQFGCDGQRYVFSGRSCVYDRGTLKEVMPADSSLLSVEKHIILYDVVPDEIDEHRAQSGIRSNLAEAEDFKLWNLSCETNSALNIDGSYKVLQYKIELPGSTEIGMDRSVVPVAPAEVSFQDEINIYVCLWLWDYLRRSGMRGFMMPLSGGLDSSTVAMLVFAMCNHLHRLLSEGHSSITDYFARCHSLTPIELSDALATPQRICNLLLKCTYISTKYSSQETESRARKLCQAIGADFSVVSIQDVYEMCRLKDMNDRPLDKVTLLDQNLQARLRMTMTYYLSEGNRIVLATGNVDEAIMGYLTKYDCSSADINPIGGLCKDDLKSYLKYCCRVYEGHASLVDTLGEIIEAPPSAELTGSEQRDEDEIGITYDEISVLGKVRRGIYGCCGPKGAFECVWRHRNQPPFSTKIRCLSGNGAEGRPGEVAAQLGELIKRFYRRYFMNRHKLTVLTPALHAETYSPDDNRFDHRQFLYPRMELQFAGIDKMVALIAKSGSL